MESSISNSSRCCLCADGITHSPTACVAAGSVIEGDCSGHLHAKPHIRLLALGVHFFLKKTSKQKSKLGTDLEMNWMGICVASFEARCDQQLGHQTPGPEKQPTLSKARSVSKWG